MEEHNAIDFLPEGKCETVQEAREKILAIEDQIRDELPPVELETIHHFSKGIYARELHIPKGVVLTGKIHKHEHLNIISKGKIAVYTDEGRKVIEAPATIVSPPGVKRVGLALEDTVWTTIHASEERDLDKLEEIFIAPTFDDVPQLENTETKTLCHGPQSQEPQ